jgi:hypothetical protein
MAKLTGHLSPTGRLSLLEVSRVIGVGAPGGIRGTSKAGLVQYAFMAAVLPGAPAIGDKKKKKKKEPRYINTWILLY